jgi:dihydrodipicolinate synthase/N-acetylneuraminate lyase
VDPKIIVSGMGEQPAIIHLRDFGLVGFTSGCVCVRPDMSRDMLEAILAGDFDQAETIRSEFEGLEDLRNQINPIRVLHDALALCGIAETGPALPLLSNLKASDKPAVEAAARALLNR